MQGKFTAGFVSPCISSGRVVSPKEKTSGIDLAVAGKLSTGAIWFGFDATFLRRWKAGGRYLIC